MTINQAKGLKLGQEVTNIITKSKGQVIGMYQNRIIIEWNNSDIRHHYPWDMNSIHVMAN